MAGDYPYGVLTLDAPKPDSLGQPDLEIMKTLASLLGVGLALADSREVTVNSDLFASVGSTLLEANER